MHPLLPKYSSIKHGESAFILEKEPFFADWRSAYSMGALISGKALI